MNRDDEAEVEKLTPEELDYMKRVAAAKDSAAREAMLDLMSPFAFTVVAFDQLTPINEQWAHVPPHDRLQWSMDGVRVDGARLLLTMHLPPVPAP